jgi:hypothetical protein
MREPRGPPSPRVFVGTARATPSLPPLHDWTSGLTRK